jgi:CspA family cold shock protein
MARVRGSVKWYNDARGFGFATRDDGRADVFVHATALRAEPRPLYEGERIEFDVVPDRNGRTCADNVVRIQSSPYANKPTTVVE